MIDLGDVRLAAQRIAGAAHRTPVLTSRTLDQAVGAAVFLKAENFQRTGSFKVRGATNKIASLTAEDRARGVVAVSSGNHAAAVAFAARLFGTSATVVMPEDAPSSKRAATEGYGATVVPYDRYRERREDIAERIVAETGRVLVRPYDDWAVMAGQGTAALELVEAVGPLDALVVCVGGGGLIAGCSTAAKGLHPGTVVVGVEPEAGDDTRRSLAAGRRVRLDEVPRTIADGQAVDEPGELTFEVNRRLVDEVVTASDEEILDAMRFCFERLRVVVEPSGACALAAVLAGAVGDLRGRRVGVTLSGGNVDVARFRALFA
ncbi:MAG: pyridoxal-phosphate dependent enzyme [Acidimicrobiia bacterium]|nr:pyridoxal-phosphate dependent enzyme [Acidimicrobiia bacterium]